MLARCATVNRQHPEGLVHLIEVLRNSHESSGFGGDRVSAAATLNSGMGQSRDFDDPQGMTTSYVSCGLSEVELRIMVYISNDCLTRVSEFLIKTDYENV